MALKQHGNKNSTNSSEAKTVANFTPEAYSSV